jgi:hypothetical protein
MATSVASASTVTFQEHKILPAPHAQKNLPDESEMMRIGRVDGDLGRSAARDVVAGRILFNIDRRNRPPAGYCRSHVLQRARGLQLPERDRCRSRCR